MANPFRPHAHGGDNRDTNIYWISCCLRRPFVKFEYEGTEQKRFFLTMDEPLVTIPLGTADNLISQKTFRAACFEHGVFSRQFDRRDWDQFVATLLAVVKQGAVTKSAAATPDADAPTKNCAETCELLREALVSEFIAYRAKKGRKS